MMRLLIFEDLLTALRRGTVTGTLTLGVNQAGEESQPNGTWDSWYVREIEALEGPVRFRQFRLITLTIGEYKTKHLWPGSFCW